MSQNKGEGARWASLRPCVRKDFSRWKRCPRQRLGRFICSAVNLASSPDCGRKGLVITQRLSSFSAHACAKFPRGNFATNSKNHGTFQVIDLLLKKNVVRLLGILVFIGEPCSLEELNGRFAGLVV